MAEWTAEVVLDLEHVRRLVAPLHGQPPVDLLALAEGWDNAVFLADGTWVYRFPRRAIAVPGVALEAVVLPDLAPRLPLRIPVPERLGAPSADFPWPFLGYRLVPGRDLATAGLDGAGLARLAEPLGRFLRALHDPALARRWAGRLPEDPLGRCDIGRRVPRTLDVLAGLADQGHPIDLPALTAAVRSAGHLGRMTPRAVVHGDLHLRHLLVDDAGDLCAVIDWGDLHIGHPAVDLSVYWAVLPLDARAAFLAAYGPVDEDTLLAARVIAIYIAAALVRSAADVGTPAVRREALAALARALEG